MVRDSSDRVALRLRERSTHAQALERILDPEFREAVLVETRKVHPNSANAQVLVGLRASLQIRIDDIDMQLQQEGKLPENAYGAPPRKRALFRGGALLRITPI